MTLISGIIDGAKPYCVYFHLIDQTLFYVGSGVLSRAFDHGSARRNEAWNRFSAGRRVSVQIVGQYEERAIARREEYAAIKAQRPLANLPYDPAEPFEWQERAGVAIPWLVATDAYVGMQIRVDRPDGTYSIFRTLAEAAGCMRVSKSAVSNSITGRYPVVGGLRFTREPRPAAPPLVWDEAARRWTIPRPQP